VYPGKWELPYATEVESQEQAVKMADHFSRLFQRSVKALDNHRLAKAKLKRLYKPTT
jgi:2,3-bisphosphoglycerate-independent phosphoglycerate mutase